MARHARDPSRTTGPTAPSPLGRNGRKASKRAAAASAETTPQNAAGRREPFYRGTVFVGVAIGVLGAVLGTQLNTAVDVARGYISHAVAEPKPPPPPFDYVVNYDERSWPCSTWAINKPPSQVKDPGELPSTPIDPHQWGAQYHGIDSGLDGGETRLRLSIEGAGSQAVILQGIRVVIDSRAAPRTSNLYALGYGCGDAATLRFFNIDLDAPHPKASPGEGRDARTDKVIPAVGFPFMISLSSPEIFQFTAYVRKSDIQWHLVILWTSGNRSGDLTITSGGKPFRTTPATRESTVYLTSNGTGWKNMGARGNLG